MCCGRSPLFGAIIASARLFVWHYSGSAAMVAVILCAPVDTRASYGVPRLLAPDAHVCQPGIPPMRYRAAGSLMEVSMEVNMCFVG